MKRRTVIVGAAGILGLTYYVGADLSDGFSQPAPANIRLVDGTNTDYMISSSVRGGGVDRERSVEIQSNETRVLSDMIPFFDANYRFTLTIDINAERAYENEFSSFEFRGEGPLTFLIQGEQSVELQ